MVIKNYSFKKDSRDSPISLEEINWKNRGNLLIKFQYEQSKGGRQDRGVYFVMGFNRSKNETTENINYSYEPITKKLQKNCRAFLRGTGNETGMNGLTKIVFIN